MALASNRRSARVEQWIRRRIPTLLSGIVLIAIWAGIARYIDDNRIFATIPYTIDGVAAHKGTIAVKITETFASVAVAFVLAVIFGVLLGLVIAEIFTIRRLTMPLVIFGYAIPHPVLAPVFIIWFIKWDPIVLVSFTGPAAYLFDSVAAADAQVALAINGVTTFGAWVGFFPVFINTITGMNELEERYEHLGTLLGATRWQMVRYFRFWRALPNITSSIKSTVQLSIVGVIVAEFIAASSGIGYEIVLAYKTNELGYMFGVILIIMIGSYLFYQLVGWLLKVLTPPGSVA